MFKCLYNIEITSCMYYNVTKSQRILSEDKILNEFRLKFFSHIVILNIVAGILCTLPQIVNFACFII